MKKAIAQHWIDSCCRDRDHEINKFFSKSLKVTPRSLTDSTITTVSWKGERFTLMDDWCRRFCILTPVYLNEIDARHSIITNNSNNNLIRNVNFKAYVLDSYHANNFRSTQKRNQITFELNND